jgi:hypothetical protein
MNAIKPTASLVAVLCVLPVVTAACVVWNIPQYFRS